MEMTRKQIDDLLEIIEDLVAAEGAYKEKAAQIKGRASDTQVTALFEFVSWFDDEGDE